MDNIIVYSRPDYSLIKSRVHFFDGSAEMFVFRWKVFLPGYELFTGERGQT